MTNTKGDIVMVKITNKVVKVGERELSYADLIRTSVQNPPQGGFSVKEMKDRMRILDAVDLAEKNKAEIQLEDADAERLAACVAQMRWAVLDPAIVGFCDEVAK